MWRFLHTVALVSYQAVLVVAGLANIDNCMSLSLGKSRLVVAIPHAIACGSKDKGVLNVAAGRVCREAGLGH